MPRPRHVLLLCCSKVLGAIGKEVKEFYGGNHSQAALTQTTGVIVCTIEKANIMWVPSIPAHCSGGGSSVEPLPLRCRS